MTSGDAAAPVVLTLDVGTSSVRCCAFDARGAQVPGVMAARDVRPRVSAAGASELDADTLLDDALACLDEGARAAAAQGQTILGVGVCTFWHAFLGVDAAGAALTPLYLWNDTRAGPAARELRRRYDQAAVHRRTGCVFHPSYLPARLAWLAGAEPERFRRCARFLSFGEYLEQRLFGEPRCSVSMASGTGLFDQQALRWDEPLLEALGLDAGRLAPVARGHAPRAGLRGAYARRLPALREVPFFPALGDGACSNLGSGAVRPGHAALMIGTSAAMRLLFADGAPPAPPGLWRYLLDERRGLIGGALSNGGNVYAWLGGTLRLPPEDALEAALLEAEPAAHGLVMLPFLAGERNPDFPLEATGALTGLRTATTATDIVQAALEAVAYRLAAIADRLREAQPRLEGTIASGGLLRSPAWLRILTDALGLPVVHSTVQEASSRGAALMALEALGELPSALEAPAPLGVTERPDPARHARHQAARAAHERLYARHVHPDAL